MNRELHYPGVTEEAKMDIDLVEGDIELTGFGPSCIASLACGERIDDLKIQEIVECASSSKSRREVGQLMQSTGINVRYSSQEITKDPVEVCEMAARIGGSLTRSVIAGQGWDSADYFVDCSSTLPVQVGMMALDSAGLESESVIVKPYRAACAGAVMAFVDTLANEKLQDSRVVICAMETLSQLVTNEHFSSKLENLSVPIIFGDDFAAIAYRPSDYLLVSAQNRIIYDGAPIRFITEYDVPEFELQNAPPHYVFGNGGRENISVSERGVFTNIHKPISDLPFEMDGKQTAKFFIKETVDVMKQVYMEAKFKGVNPKKVILHQPSQRVTDGIKRRVEADEILKELELPEFILGDIERSNSGSATTLIVWQNLIKMKFIEPGEPFLLCAPGIGAVISAAVIVPKG